MQMSLVLESGKRCHVLLIDSSNFFQFFFQRQIYLHESAMFDGRFTIHCYYDRIHELNVHELIPFRVYACLTFLFCV